MGFSINTIDDFDHLSGPKRDKEVNRTRRGVVDWLNERPRTEFPAVEVRFCNKVVQRHIVDAAYTAARMARRAAGSPKLFNWLEAVAAAMPAALEADRARIARLEPIAHLNNDGARKNDEAAREGLPRELTAPLLLEMPAVAF